MSKISFVFPGLPERNPGLKLANAFGVTTCQPHPGRSPNYERTAVTEGQSHFLTSGGEAVTTKCSSLHVPSSASKYYSVATPTMRISRGVRESLKVPARVWRATFGSFLEDDFSGELGRIKTPVLIVWGDKDAPACEVIKRQR